MHILEFFFVNFFKIKARNLVIALQKFTKTQAH